MRKFLLSPGIWTAAFGGIGVARQTKEGPRDWRLILMWVSWGVTVALAVGTVLRRSAAAVTTVVATTVLAYLLALIPFLPPPMAQWLARFTPVAGLAVQQTLIRYPQVDSVYTPANGYYPLPPWTGFAVLCGYAVLALGLATVLLRRRDA